MSDIKKTSMGGFHVSELSETLQDVDTLQLAKEMDSDRDGFINDQDFAAAVKSLQASRKENKSLKKIGCGLLSACLLLVGSTIGASISAARASNDTVVDEGGVLHAKGTGAIVKTQEALNWAAKPNVLGMSTGELIGLKDLVLFDGNVHFRINGFTKSQDKVTLLVEGGTVSFNEKGIVDTTGSVEDAFSAVLRSKSGDVFQRRLQGGWYGCENRCTEKWGIDESYKYLSEYYDCRDECCENEPFDYFSISYAGSDDSWIFNFSNDVV